MSISGCNISKCVASCWFWKEMHSLVLRLHWSLTSGFCGLEQCVSMASLHRDLGRAQQEATMS